MQLEFNNEQIDSVILRELKSTGAPFIRFFTNGGKYIWDATVEKDINGKSFLKVYQVITVRDIDCPIVASTTEQIKELEKNFDIEFGITSLWNPYRSYMSKK